MFKVKQIFFSTLSLLSFIKPAEGIESPSNTVSVFINARKSGVILGLDSDSVKKDSIIRRMGDNMVLVVGGTFTMGCTSKQGSDGEPDEKPAHQVTLSSYKMGKYEVTQAEWEAVMGSNPSGFSGCPTCPVEQVSWNDIQLFLQKLNSMTGGNYRLPTEAEWEFAARGGKVLSRAKYSGNENLDTVGWYDGNSGYKTQPVGQKEPNALGIYDMSGNVREWCGDWKGNYSSNAQTNPRGPSSGTNRVLRGGSWICIAKYCQVTSRNFYGHPDYRNDNNGFRLVSPEVFLGETDKER